MCFINEIFYLFRAYITHPLYNLWREVVRLTRVTPYSMTLVFAACYSCAIFFYLIPNAYIKALFFIGFVIFAIPLVITCHDRIVRKYRTHGVERQDFHSGYRFHYPDAPLVPEDQLRSVISIAPPTAIWSREPLRVQPVLNRRQIRDQVYRRISPTPRPRRRAPESSKKRGSRKQSDSKQSGFTNPLCSHGTTYMDIQQPDYQKPGTSRDPPSVDVAENKDNLPATPSESREKSELKRSVPKTPVTRQTTRRSVQQDYQQPGTSTGNPCVVIDVPEIENDSPVDTAESRKPFSETVYDPNFLFPDVYNKRPVRSSEEAKNEETSFGIEDESSYTPEKQFSGKGDKDSDSSSFTKRCGISRDVSTTKDSSQTESVKSMKKQTQLDRPDTSSSKRGTADQETEFSKDVQSALPTEVSKLEHVSSDEGSSSRASDSGTPETFSERSVSPASSRHSSPGDGKRSPKFEDPPKVHISRKSSKKS